MEDFARVLYASLRDADIMGIEKVVVVAPENIGIGVAINDRLNKASFDS